MGPESRGNVPIARPGSSRRHWKAILQQVVWAGAAGIGKGALEGVDIDEVGGTNREVGGTTCLRNSLAGSSAGG